MGSTRSLDALEPLRDWFRAWNLCIIANDFVSARPLFDDTVSGFGTFAPIVFGQSALEREQWSKVWPSIEDFRFDVTTLHGALHGPNAWAAVRWASTGFYRDGATFARPGRATVVLRCKSERWLGVHTHFSLDPGTPPLSHGRPPRSSMP